MVENDIINRNQHCDRLRYSLHLSFRQFQSISMLNRYARLHQTLSELEEKRHVISVHVFCLPANRLFDSHNWDCNVNIVIYRSFSLATFNALLPSGKDNIRDDSNKTFFEELSPARSREYVSGHVSSLPSIFLIYV